MKRVFCMVAVICMSFSLLSACSNNEGADTGQQPEVQEPSGGEEDDPAETVTEGNYTIGVLQYAPHPSLDNCREGFIEGLRQSGLIEGENITFDLQNALGENQNVNIMAQSFVSKQYDLICAIATPAAVMSKTAAAGSGIPVVFNAVSDPVAAELVDSLESPGQGVTGTSDLLPLEKQMQLIRNLMPEATTIGILYTTGEVNSLTHLEEFEALAPQYGFTIESQGVTSSSEIPLALDTLLPKVDCINNFTDNNVVNNLDTLLFKANEAGVPVFGSEVEQVVNGCIASESIDYYELGIETGKIAARILSGEDVSQIPVSVISTSVPVFNKEVLEKFNIEIPDVYQNPEYVDTEA